LDILISLIESKELALIVVDSVAMLTPKAEIEGTMEDNQIGLQARMMGKVCRKIVASSAKNNVCVLWINQIRYKTNISFGNPETRPCGKALDFMTSVMVKISKTDVEKDKSGAGGKIVVQKNKMAPPFKIAEFDIVFGKGIESGLVDAAVEAGIIVKNGAWYSYKENRLGQGKDNSDDFIRTNPQLLAEITQKLKEKEFGAG
jgi:recombination protein RecA